MIICGVDPGLNGAIARLRSAPGVCEIEAIDDMPILVVRGKGKKSLHYHGLAMVLSNVAIGHAFVEKTWNRPGEGHSGMLMGCYMATLQALATLGIPWTPVAPQTWKRQLGVPAAKDGARARASELMPSGCEYWRRAKDDGRAEAALIALWGIRSFERIGKTELPSDSDTPVVFP